MKDYIKQIRDVLLTNRYLLLITLFFGVIYCSISLVNHYYFRSYGFDLGIYNNIIFDYSHFRLNNNMIMHKHFDNILSDHFCLLHFLIAPLYYLFGSYTMLIVQILGILWGGIGIYTLINRLTSNKNLSLLAIIHFYGMWGIYSALGFDYHDNVLAAMFVPWFFYFVHEEKWKKAAIYFTLILISKENMALWAFFLSVGLFWNYFKEKTKRIPLAIFSTVAIVYFLAVIKVFIPALLNENTSYGHLKYSSLGDSLGDYIITAITRPKYVFTLLFENHINASYAFGIKSELHFVILVSGGFALFYKPQYLFMLIPIYAQKLFNDSPGKWGINHQYSIEFVPILTIALFLLIYEIKNHKLRKAVAILSVLVCLINTQDVIDGRVSKWYNPINQMFWAKEHYQQDFDVKEMYKLLELIPDDASVCAQSMLVPHLAFRDSIFHYPYINNAEFIALVPGTKSTYPFKRARYKREVEKLRKSKKYEIFIENDFALFFRKRSATQKISKE